MDNSPVQHVFFPKVCIGRLIPSYNLHMCVFFCNFAGNLVLMRNTLYLILIVWAFTACHSVKNAATVPFIKIEYGNGGGFVGSVTENMLMGDGTLIKENESPRKIAPAEMDSVVALVNRASGSYVCPGNVYCYVNIYCEADTLRYSWSFGDKKMDKNIKLLYKKLTDL